MYGLSFDESAARTISSINARKSTQNYILGKRQTTMTNIHDSHCHY